MRAESQPTKARQAVGTGSRSWGKATSRLWILATAGTVFLGYFGLIWLAARPSAKAHDFQFAQFAAEEPSRTPESIHWRGDSRAGPVWPGFGFGGGQPPGQASGTRLVPVAAPGPLPAMPAVPRLDATGGEAPLPNSASGGAATASHDGPSFPGVVRRLPPVDEPAGASGAAAPRPRTYGSRLAQVPFRESQEEEPSSEEESSLEEESPVGEDEAGASPAATTQPPTEALPPPPAQEPSVSGESVSLPEKVSGDRVRLPLAGSGLESQVNVRGTQSGISLRARNADLGTVMGVMAEELGLNVILADGATGSITVTLTDVTLDEALHAILTATGHTWTRRGSIVVISRLAQGGTVPPGMQGRELATFPLNFVSALDVEKVASSLLSPVGKMIPIESSPDNRRKTQELIVVEDLPEYLARVAQYIHQVDRPPRQVLIEARVLQVDLEDETSHGVNFEALFRAAGADVSIAAQGFASATASPAFIFDVAGTDLENVVEALKKTTDAKTLATPKTLVVNGQKSRIQVGSRLPYVLTTTTETSTLESVEFLDVGVVLDVTPQISDHDTVLMTVKPEISTGEIDPVTALPTQDTTLVESTVLLRNGRAMIIGGLIQDRDTDTQSKLPLLGDLWLVGKLFQRRTMVRTRTEIIIAIVPRVVPYDPHYQVHADVEAARAMTPLLYGPLWRVPRPWEPYLPDSDRYHPRIPPSR